MASSDLMPPSDGHKSPLDAPDVEVSYLSGFGAEHETCALPGANPVAQNSPQICPYGLYGEQINGTAFTCPRAKNQRTWLYRVRPAVIHEKFVPMEHTTFLSDFSSARIDPNQYRWHPKPMPEATAEVDFVDGIFTMAGHGDPLAKSGIAIHMYTCNKSMIDTCFFNSDGDFLIVPQAGTLRIQTEMGLLHVAPKEICVIPRGIRFRVAVDGMSRGYICEVYGGHFTLPDLGPIGSNCLANPRDFFYPVAAFEDRDVDYVVINKFGGKLFTSVMHHSPFDVVAWHGNYAPFKYDLERFNTLNSVSYDHPDPSIYCVLTVPTDTPGVALCDFVIFPPRWMVMEHSFRPPWYHRNTMSEFMGMVWGKYDAKEGFQAGGASMHSCMTPHGPDEATFLKASAAELKPDYFNGGLAFMFESTIMMKLTAQALDADHLERDYRKCWQQLPRVFDPTCRDVTTLSVRTHPHPTLSHGIGHGPIAADGACAWLKRAAIGCDAPCAGGSGAGCASSAACSSTAATGTGAGAGATGDDAHSGDKRGRA